MPPTLDRRRVTVSGGLQGSRSAQAADGAGGVVDQARVPVRLPCGVVPSLCCLRVRSVVSHSEGRGRRASIYIHAPLGQQIAACLMLATAPFAHSEGECAGPPWPTGRSSPQPAKNRHG
jgi:hypothetical protein